MSDLEKLINGIVTGEIENVDDTVKTDLSEIEDFIKALSGGYNTDQTLIANKVLEFGTILLRKNRNYDSSVFKQPLLAPDVNIDSAIRVRMSDKVERLMNLFKKDQNDLVGESVLDTVKDLGGYCILWLIYKEALSQ